MNIDRAKDELTDYYYRQLESGFPNGSMIKIRNMSKILAVAGHVEVDDLMLEVRRAALYKLSINKRLSQQSA